MHTKNQFLMSTKKDFNNLKQKHSFNIQKINEHERKIEGLTKLNSDIRIQAECLEMELKHHISELVTN